MQTTADQLPDEEFANCLTHTGGFLLALVGAGLLVSAVSNSSNDLLRFSCWIYAAALVAVYGASALSHSFENPARRNFFRRMDQGVIFVFITANFSPVAVVCLRDDMRWIVLATMWSIALVGFSSKVFWGHRVDATAVTHYLALGWLPVTMTEPILQTLPTRGIYWSVAGGLCYTIGTIFLSCDTKVRYFHALWHLLVIAGSYCHFLVIVNYVIPLSAV